jgi:AcrR family transcriptional regulator
VARGVILAHGPAVSTALIAEHAGVSQATLFKRFGTKEALVVRALAAPECMAFVDVLAAGPDARPIPEQLAAAGAEILAFYTRMVPAVQALFAAGVRPDCAFAGEVPPPLRYAFMGALHGRVFLRHFLSGPAPAEPADDARFVAGLVDALWAGLAPGGR